MQTYISAFKEAQAWTDAYAGRMSNYPLDIIPSLGINKAIVATAIAKDFSSFLPHSDVLPGMCFRVARELSYVLFELGIRHTVTVGDIELVDGMYVGLNQDKLKQDLDEGYQLDFDNGRPVGRPIDAHAWITLEDGTVIDSTILPSQHRKQKGSSQPLPFEEAVYFSGKPNTPVIRHIPMMTGFVYHQRVLTALEDGSCRDFCQWYEDYARLMARHDLMRLAPGLLQP